MGPPGLLLLYFLRKRDNFHCLGAFNVNLPYQMFLVNILQNFPDSMSHLFQQLPQLSEDKKGVYIKTEIVFFMTVSEKTSRWCSLNSELCKSLSIWIVLDLLKWEQMNSWNTRACFTHVKLHNLEIMLYKIRLIFKLSNQRQK